MVMPIGGDGDHRPRPAVAQAGHLPCHVMVRNVGVGLVERVRSTPDAPAVRHDGRDTSYHELAVAARAMAEALRARGLGPGDRVGLAVAPGPDLVAALVAVAAIGAAYVPLDNRHASRRL